MTELTGIVTTDLAAMTRGRFVPANKLESFAATGIGWVPANISLTPFGSIADPNPWGSTGDLRLIPDLSARYRTDKTGSPTSFDIVPGNLVELDGTPWSACTRTALIQAMADLKAQTGLSIKATFEQEFQVFGAGFSPEQPFTVAALRRADPFASDVMAALEEAGVCPEMILAEYGEDQFELTHAPCDPLAAADRAVAIREIIREMARIRGWKASFAPKTSPTSVGNGVHIHFSFEDAAGNPVTYDAEKPAGLSQIAGSFCAGVLAHLPAILAMTASSVPSYYRLKPHNWSSSYTWLADKDREASLRICPVVTFGGRNPAKSYNIEYRPADATANPYLAMACLVRAGLSGLLADMPSPPLVTGDPSIMSDEDLRKNGLLRLPTSLSDSLLELASVTGPKSWFAHPLMESFLGVKNAEIAALTPMDDLAICRLYRDLF